MDALKAEIAVKRKAIQDDPMTGTRPNKYMRRGDIEKLREEQERKEREEKEQVERVDKERLAEVAALKKAARAKGKVCTIFSTSILGTERGFEDRPLRAPVPTRPLLVLLPPLVRMAT